MFWDTQSRRSSRNYPSKSDRTPQLVNEAKLLDRHYIPTRYTNSHPEGAPMDYYTRQDALEALRIAEKVQQYCEDRIRCTEKKS
jgi:HEPN domain-containing protein